MVFSSRSPSLSGMYKFMPEKVDEFIALLGDEVNIYIDYANIRPWSEKLGWHIDMKRLKQLFDAIEQIKICKVYYGTIAENQKSIDFIKELSDAKYHVETKPVKFMHLSIDAKSVQADSPSLLKDFVKYALLKNFNLDEIKYLNGVLYRLNTQGITKITDMKCNFDVEIGRDMLSDFRDTKADTYILFGSDSDFESPIKQLLKDGKKVILLATVRRVSRELSHLQSDGLVIFEIQKIRDFICWKKEITGS